MDQNLQYQQNLADVDLAIVVIIAPTNRRQDVAPIMPQVNAILGQIRAGELQVVTAPPPS